MLVLGFILGHMSMNTLANVCFKLSAAADARHFLMYQVAGNLAGFVGVLSYTGLLRHVPLHVAFPVTQGLAMVAVQLVSARWFSRQPIAPVQWLGVAFILAGIVMVSSKKF